MTTDNMNRNFPDSDEKLRQALKMAMEADLNVPETDLPLPSPELKSRIMNASQGGVKKKKKSNVIRFVVGAGGLVAAAAVCIFVLSNLDSISSTSPQEAQYFNISHDHSDQSAKSDKISDSSNKDNDNWAECIEESQEIRSKQSIEYCEESAETAPTDEKERNQTQNSGQTSDPHKNDPLFETTVIDSGNPDESDSSSDFMDYSSGVVGIIYLDDSSASDPGKYHYILVNLRDSDIVLDYPGNESEQIHLGTKLGVDQSYELFSDTPLSYIMVYDSPDCKEEDGLKIPVKAIDSNE